MLFVFNKYDSFFRRFRHFSSIKIKHWMKAQMEFQKNIVWFDDVHFDTVIYSLALDERDESESLRKSPSLICWLHFFFLSDEFSLSFVNALGTYT